MTKWTRWVTLAGVVAALLASSGSRAGANFVTYTETLTAKGSLNGVDFNFALLTVTATGDTANISSTSEAGVIGNPVSVSFSVNGVGSGTFTGSYVVFDNPSTHGAGVTLGTLTAPVTDLLDTSNLAFNTYGLATSIGPVSGQPNFGPGVPFASDAGPLVITLGESAATFTAVVTPSVPEPSSLVLMGIGGIAGLGYVWRRRPAQAVA